MPPFLCTTKSDAEQYVRSVREKILASFGPLPERTPLKPRITGTVERDTYKIEKVIFESQPSHFVTAAVFLPDPSAHEPPYPGVLVPCGHSANGKAATRKQR